MVPIELSLEEFPVSNHADWRAAAELALKGVPLEKALYKKLPEGIVLEPLYDAENAITIANPPPGAGSLVRGNYVQGHHCRVARDLALSDPDEFHAVATEEGARGLDMLVVHHGCSDQAGLQIENVADLETAFGGLTLEDLPRFVWAGATALPFAALVKASGMSWCGGILADPVTTWARTGTSPTGWDDLFDDLHAVSEWNQKAGLKLKTIGVEAYRYTECGAGMIEELAFMTATFVEVLRALQVRGKAPAEAAPECVVSLGLTSGIFSQIAKIRAARILWARILEAFGVESTPLYIHARTSDINKSTLEAHTNILRGTAEAFAGIIAGVESIEVTPFNAASGGASEFSRRLARNIPIILMEECGLSRVADPAGGSWYVETLTSEVANKAWCLFQDIEKRGGMIAALAAGFPQELAARSGDLLLRNIDNRRESLIGVNLYPNPGENIGTLAVIAQPLIWPPLPNGETPRTIGALAEKLAAGTSLTGASEGLRKRSASAELIARLQPIRAAELYEILRATAENFRLRVGKLPEVWLAKFGAQKEFAARVEFSSGFLAAGGFAIRQGGSIVAIKSAVDAAVACAAPVVVLCSADAKYPEVVPEFVALLKSRLPDVCVILAGHPGENEKFYRDHGVDEFIHVRLDCAAFLQNLHKRLGMTQV